MDLKNKIESKSLINFYTCKLNIGLRNPDIKSMVNLNKLNNKSNAKKKG
jgi:hypothetical protein